MTTKSKTAAQFLEELRRNPEFAAGEKLRERQNREREQALQKEQMPLLSDLKNLGIEIETVWDLVNTSENYSVAIPVLVQHLSGPYSAGVREGIIRALTVDYAGSNVLRALVDEFKKQNDDSETSLKWVLGNAIATVAKPSDANTLISLAVDRSHGKVRWPRLSEQIFRVDKWSVCRG
jgi:hypothetical protein